MVKVILAGVFMLAMALPASAFGMCSGPNRAERKVTCLVDGDTGWQNGVKWRLNGVDTPEYPPRAECNAESEAAKFATLRMLELMQDGYQIEWLNKKGKHKRDLVRVILPSGKDAGKTLIDEGFAQPWPNTGNIWCRP